MDHGVGDMEFQSTLPVRGATISGPAGALFNRISIHAPREGSDCVLEYLHKAGENFNPRSP